MNTILPPTSALDRLPIPTAISRLAIASLVARSDRSLSVRAAPGLEAVFAALMRDAPITGQAGHANREHDELPPAFFEAFLGPRLKLSSCLYDLDDPADGIVAAEERAIAETISHANLIDGQSILELGCGWGSLTVAMAARFPNAMITAVSNSHSQALEVERLADLKRLPNIKIVTADVNEFDPARRFDRIVSVEMFEHIENWARLLDRIRDWLAPQGRLFLHVLSHATSPYRCLGNGAGDWIGQQHVAAGGIMPSHRLIHQFDHLFRVEREWRWDGRHYQRTALDWLSRYDRSADVVVPLLRTTYGCDAALWRRRWRLFFLATAGLFGHRGGQRWGVSHYRLAPCP